MQSRSPSRNRWIPFYFGGRNLNTYDAIKTRRSTRKFKSEQIDNEQLSKIIDAGRAAPCGGNSQSTHFIVIRNKKVLDDLANLARDAFAKMEVHEDTYKSLKMSILSSKKGSYVFHYNAPVLIVTANKINYDNSMADCACAIENMMLEANDLDLGCCYINQLNWLSDDENIRAYMLKLGLAEDERIFASMVVGKADSKDGLPIRTERPITGNPVDYVD